MPETPYLLSASTISNDNTITKPFGLMDGLPRLHLSNEKNDSRLSAKDEGWTSQRRESLHYDDFLLETGRGSNISRGSSEDAAGYEISNDFIQKQIEALERKYGDRSVVRHAAITIQHAYRSYCLRKAFINIRGIQNTHSERSGPLPHQILHNEHSLCGHTGGVGAPRPELHTSGYATLPLRKASAKDKLAKKAEIDLSSTSLSQPRIQYCKQLSQRCCSRYNACDITPGIPQRCPSCKPIVGLETKQPQHLTATRQRSFDATVFNDCNGSRARGLSILKGIRLGRRSKSSDGLRITCNSHNLSRGCYSDLRHSTNTDETRQTLSLRASLKNQPQDKVLARHSWGVARLLRNNTRSDRGNFAFMSTQIKCACLRVTDDHSAKDSMLSSATNNRYKKNYQLQRDNIPFLQGASLDLTESRHEASSRRSFRRSLITKLSGRENLKTSGYQNCKWNCHGASNPPLPPCCSGDPVGFRIPADEVGLMTAEADMAAAGLPNVMNPITKCHNDTDEGISHSTSTTGRTVPSLCPCHCIDASMPPKSNTNPTSANSPQTMTVAQRLRQYRIALNIFNKTPERGIDLLIRWCFIDPSPVAVARFLLEMKQGLSKQMIGEYLGNLQNRFNSEVLQSFANEYDFSGFDIDIALRQFQSSFRLPGEAQKIERIIEIFADRYIACNPNVTNKFKSVDTIFILSFAIIMLNTDLHSPSVKPDKKMKLEEFVANLKGIDNGSDIDYALLCNIYKRIQGTEFRHNADHVSQVMKLDRVIVGKKPYLPLPHRRLVCYCRLYEVPDLRKKQNSNAHQREVFLFNDIILITKVLSKRNINIIYNYRDSISLTGLNICDFRTRYYPYGIRLNQTFDKKCVVLNARQEDEKQRFVEDLEESVKEANEMEALRIEAALEKQRRFSRPSPSFLNTQRASRFQRLPENRDSGLGDMDDTLTELKIDNLDRHRDDPYVLPVGTREGSAQSASIPNLLFGSCQTCHNSNAMSLLRHRRSISNSLDSGMASNTSIVSKESTLVAGAPCLPTNGIKGSVLQQS